MKRLWLCGLATLLGLMLSNGGASFGDENAATPEKQTVDKVTGTDAAKTATKTAARPHLPRLFGRLHLSPEQREKLKAVQAKYAPQIKEMQMKIAELQKQQMAESHAILDEAQKSQLAEMKEQMAKNAAAKKAAKATAKPVADSDKK